MMPMLPQPACRRGVIDRDEHGGRSIAARERRGRIRTADLVGSVGDDRAVVIARPPDSRNVIGNSGGVVPLFMEQIPHGEPVTVTHPEEVTRCFLRQCEAISLVLQAATLGADRSVLILAMGEPIRIASLSRGLIRLSGDDSVEIEFTELRPGELLFEDVRLDSETMTPTVLPQNVVTRAIQPEGPLVARLVSELDTVASVGGDAVALPVQLVPEYITSATPDPENGVRNSTPAISMAWCRSPESRAKAGTAIE